VSGRATGALTPDPVVADPAVVYRRAPGVLTRRTPRSLVVLAERSTEPLRISGSAAVVWELLAKPARGSELAGAAARRAGRSLEVIRPELDAALHVLIAAGVVSCA